MKDLFNNSIGPAKPFPLTLWQKRHAAILYHYASLDYLKALVTKIDAVLHFLDNRLDVSAKQGRDQVLTSKRWGARNTSANFSTYGWPFLSAFRQTTLEQVAERAKEIYGQTDARYCGGGLREVSMNWMTPEEHEKFDVLWEGAFRHASNIDKTLDSDFARWDDAVLTIKWLEISVDIPRLPKFLVRTDIEAETGKKPPRTGVYVPATEPYGAMRFGWSGGDYNKMTGCSCLNVIGLDALNSVGRKDLWLNNVKMLDYVQHGHYANHFKQSSWYHVLNEETAWSIVSEDAFETRPCKWYFVEMIDGEYDAEAAEDAAIDMSSERLRCAAGLSCPKAGYWSTPAKADSRRLFTQGEVMPGFDSDYGATIWQWDVSQSE